MEKNVNVNFEVMGKFAMLAKALEECGLPTKFVMENGDFFLSVPLWNCENGSGEMFEVFATADEDFRIGHAVSNCHKDFEEVCDEFYSEEN